MLGVVLSWMSTSACVMPDRGNEPTKSRIRLATATAARGGEPVKRALPSQALHAVFSRLNQKRKWYEMPTVGLKALNLLSLRLDLRDLNLFDTSMPIRKHGLEDPPPEALKARRPDGRWNDPDDPDMGSNGPAFTRTINPKRV